MKTVLITGANRGIGLALAELYVAQGWQVLACCRKPEEAMQLQALAQQDNALSVHRLDITDFEQIDKLAEQINDQAIDVLLSNAGMYGPKGYGLDDIDFAQWQQVMSTNVLAVAKLAQAFLPHLLKASTPVFAALSSKVGSHTENTKGGGYIYRSSKAALNSVVKSLSNDLLSRGIKTVSLHPGWVKTEMGGPNALIDAATSAKGLKQVIDALSPEQSGGFYTYLGERIPW
ncbi:SDR family oxidoreductase [Pseudoalteromonas sp. BDTF-M6]|uniref:SDR family oxidoreductase n=1 Tax=Pseudoalteromonas sp. BDTF-M6 TaxID=2796132 RepID=UPI001BB03463|nr:SDR family oxidoreductase [Pseudoalteromonas sp. BDTF-M6]MBS3797884.1 SDR family oxidoreductase [Pseudoalteromonas sp. BDTF-M6]